MFLISDFQQCSKRCGERFWEKHLLVNGCMNISCMQLNNVNKKNNSLHFTTSHCTVIKHKAETRSLRCNFTIPPCSMCKLRLRIELKWNWLSMRCLDTAFLWNFILLIKTTLNPFIPCNSEIIVLNRQLCKIHQFSLLQQCLQFSSQRRGNQSLVSICVNPTAAVFYFQKLSCFLELTQVDLCKDLHPDFTSFSHTHLFSNLYLLHFDLTVEIFLN